MAEIEQKLIDPNIPTISPSQLGNFYSCPQKWYYGYVDELRRRGGNTFKMDRGTYFHRLCHYYYNLLRTGYRPGSPTVLAAMNKKVQEDLKELTQENIALLSSTIPVFLQFIEQRSPILDSSIEILEVEYEYYVLINTPKGRQIYLHGIIDLIYRDLYGKLHVRDHKTSERKDSFTDEKLKLDDQLFMYNLAMWRQFGEIPAGVEINFINLAKKPEIRFDKFEAVHSEFELVFYEKNLMKILDKLLDRDIYRVYGSCGGCPYNKLCVLETRGLPIEGAVSLNYERKNRGFQPNSTEETNVQGRAKSYDSSDPLIINL